MSCFSTIDFLSPKITFFQKGYRTHVSTLGGLLSIMSVIICIIISFLLSMDFIFKKNPTSYYYKKFEKECGLFTLNSQGLFHFFRFSNNYLTYPEIDTKYIRFIGIRNQSIYLENRTVLNNGEIEYWIYDKCKKGTDDKGLEEKMFSDIIDFELHVCIRYYYNPLTKKFYNNTQNGFIYPFLIHGTSNKNNLFYFLTIETCRNNSHYNLIYGNNSCGTTEDIELYKSKIVGADLYFINNYINVLNYKEPITRFIQSISGTVNNIDVPIYHLLFNPLRIITHSSTFSNSFYYTNTYSFDTREINSRNSDNYSFVDFGFWMGNNFEIYEREYKHLQNVLADIGGVIKLIFVLGEIINYPYNKFIIMKNTTKFLYEEAKNEKKIISTSVNSFSHFGTSIKDSKKKNSLLNNNYLNNQSNTNIKQKNIFPESNHDSCFQRINNNININLLKNTSDKKNDKKMTSMSLLEIYDEINFTYFIKYIFQKKKINEPIFLINKFRTKLLSEEHLYHNHIRQYILGNEIYQKKNKKDLSFNLSELYTKL